MWDALKASFDMTLAVEKNIKPPALILYLGTYQDDINQPDCKPCVTGKYCDPFELLNVTGVIQPVDCPAGFYCPTSTEFAQQNPCEAGTFSNVTQLTAQCEYS